MAIRVFVSHRRTDSELATHVANQVKRSGLDTYLDVIDDALLKDGPQLAERLLTRMARCQQLIAVVSAETSGSWWVPWEIGVGSEKGFRMASYSLQVVDLPSYLEKWPSLHSDNDIATYCQLSNEAAAEVSRRERVALSEQARTDIRKSQALDFHTRLNALLGGKTP